MNVTKDKISSVFFQYTIPSVLGMLAISSASIVDGFFVGNYVGASGLAAINISLPIFSLLFGLSLMLAIGSSVVSGKLIGFAALAWPVFLFNGTNLTISAYFTAIHKPIPSATIAILRSLILPIFFIFTLPLFFGTDGIFLAIPMAELFTFMIAIFLFKKMTPQKMM